MSAKQFTIEIEREFAAQMDAVRDAVELIALQALRGVVNKSPVDTGRFKGNWTLSIGQINTAESAVADPGGGRTIAAGAQALAPYSGLDGWPVIHVQNNLPYAVRLEEGWSAQAPGGMVGLTVAELQAQFNAMGPL